MSLVLRILIGFDEPRSGWTSLALSCSAILALVLGLILLGAGPFYVQNRWCAPDGTCYVPQFPPPIDPHIYVGLGVLLSAPCLSVAGWRLGNRHDESEEVARTRGVHSLSLVPDGRTVGKLGIILSILVVLAALGAFLYAREALKHI
jgi:hypothetical protein